MYLILKNCSMNHQLYFMHLIISGVTVRNPSVTDFMKNWFLQIVSQSAFTVKTADFFIYRNYHSIPKLFYL